MAFPSNTICCPVCSEPLRGENDLRQFKCSKGHSFDRARQGYLNLLLNTQKKSKTPGDSDAMVQARTKFLESGFYAPLLSKLISFCSEQLNIAELNSLHLCDIACGEGYYSTALALGIADALNNQVDLVGVDISQAAIRQASKKELSATWLVANAFSLPLISGSQDLVTHMFSRPCIEEAERILKPGGLLVEVKTGANHLLELRKALYPEVKHKRQNPLPSNPQGLKTVHFEEVQFEFTLQSNHDILNLLGMTPHLYRAPKDRISNVERLEQLTIQAHFEIHAFAKSHDGSEVSNPADQK